MVGLFLYFCALKRRVGRVVEGSGFENRRSVTTTRGSNPLLSAKLPQCVVGQCVAVVFWSSRDSPGTVFNHPFKCQKHRKEKKICLIFW